MLHSRHIVQTIILNSQVGKNVHVSLLVIITQLKISGVSDSCNTEVSTNWWQNCCRASITTYINLLGDTSFWFHLLVKCYKYTTQQKQLIQFCLCFFKSCDQKANSGGKPIHKHSQIGRFFPFCWNCTYAASSCNKPEFSFKELQTQLNQFHDDHGYKCCFHPKGLFKLKVKENFIWC